MARKGAKRNDGPRDASGRLIRPKTVGLTPERAAKLVAEPAIIPTEHAGITARKIKDPWDALYERGKLTAREADACLAVARAHEKAESLGGPKSCLIAFEMPRDNYFGPRSPTDKTLASVRSAQRLLAAAGQDWPMVWGVAVLGFMPYSPIHLVALKRGLEKVADVAGV
jgi:hypothetical protein